MEEAQPIFLTGANRSGTTLMFALLASHPNISMVRRTNMWRWFYGQFGDLGDRDNFERCLDAMVRYRRMRHLDPDPERIRREFWEGPPSYGRLFALFHQHYAEQVGKPRWGDKSLHTEHHAEELFAEFPRARVIHMIRDPRDRYASVLKRYDDQEKGVAAATGRWLSSTRVAQENLRRYPDRYLIVRYETLASAPEETSQKVCAFLGEPYHRQMLAMKDAPNYQAHGNSSFAQFEPGTISTRSIGRFRQVLTGRDVAFIQASAGEEMQAFAYPLDPIEMTTTDRARFYLHELPLNRVRLLGWLTLKTIGDRRGRMVPARHLQEQVG